MSCPEVEVQDPTLDCPSELDCRPGCVCDCPPTDPMPPIDYLAKDYPSFRRLLLDRLALLMPDWRERHVPDLGITLVELLAWAGDRLSYAQDAVATEAYLDTARRRVSVARHVRLVDYTLHEGTNARALVVATTDSELVLEPGDQCLTALPPAPHRTFEPIFEATPAPLVLRPEHNEIALVAPVDGEYCLPAGTTRARLNGSGLQLSEGGLVVFEEVLGPRTGHPGDADPQHRHAVRLTRVTPIPETAGASLEIEWAPEEALPFPLCLTSRRPAPDCSLLHGVSVARGNCFLVDHGATRSETLGPVPTARLEAECTCAGRPGEVTVVPGPFRPRLDGAPLTFREPLPAAAASWPARRLTRQDPRAALAALSLLEADGGATWEVRRDLLPCGPLERGVMVEMEGMDAMDNGAVAWLRFGNGESGRRPTPGSSFTARYRVGNGRAGNVGAEAIRHLVTRVPTSGVRVTLRNPWPAAGGTDPESVADARLLAPHTFRERLERAITAEDYAHLAAREFPGRVQRAAAVMRWTGCGDQVRVALDPVGGGEDESLRLEVAAALERYRRIGHEVQVGWAEYVPLELELLVCLYPDALRGEVLAALREAFSAGRDACKRPGFFHPDGLTFGAGIAVSRLVATAQGVAGVASVQVTRLVRLGEAQDPDVLSEGFFPLGPLQIARLDNDPRQPGNGLLTFDLRGGR